MKLVCPAGNLPSLKAAVNQGADAVYIGFRDDTNARHFAGLNFNDQRAIEGIRYAHARGVKVYVAINTYPQPAGWDRWQAAVDRAAELGIDALILADIGVMDYATKTWPELQAIGIEAIKLEGRQRSPAYVARVTEVWRAALDACREDPDNYRPQAHWMAELAKVSEGSQTTLGAYHRPWQ